MEAIRAVGRVGFDRDDMRTMKVWILGRALTDMGTIVSVVGVKAVPAARTAEASAAHSRIRLRTMTHNWMPRLIPPGQFFGGKAE